MLGRNPPKTVKEAIFAILSEHWPLTTKRLYGVVKKQYRLAVTYQAVHLSLQEMARDGIIAREGKEYLLNPQWIETTSQLFSSLSESYTRAHKLASQKMHEELTFKSISTCWDFLVAKTQEGFFGDSEECFVQVGRLLAAPLSKEHLAFLRSFCATHRVTVMCRRKGTVNTLVASYLRSLGMRVLVGMPCAFPTNTVILGDCVMSLHVLYPETAEKTMNGFGGGRASAFKKDFLGFFSTLMGARMTVKLIINRDPDVRKDVLLQTMRLLETPQAMR